MALDEAYFYASNRDIFCLDKNTGKTIWEFSDIDWITNIELITDHTFLVTASNNLIYIFKVKDGKRVEKVYEIKANGKLYVKPKID